MSHVGLVVALPCILYGISEPMTQKKALGTLVISIFFFFLNDLFT